eukprot:TRINITY_DN15660_c1_g1_i2.p1 TRINITY_DN15660_c1_g1~~TRINITY_DN15660_c1_g1_i2.p1  ORF type:complete len:355 (+),score=84.53 TRINITY_DN15660_c1_g1_i2:338-1402(+)
MNPLITQKRFSSSTARRPRANSKVVEFSSAEGRKMFVEALNDGYHESYFKLSEQYQTKGSTDSSGAGCLSMVLNALNVDPLQSSVVSSPVWKGVWRWFSPDMLVANNKCLREGKNTFSEFSCLSRRALSHTNDCDVTTFSDDSDLAAFRVHVQYSVSSVSAFLVAAFDQSQLLDGASSDTHFSPIASYHPGTDSVLILDVDRRNTTPYWVPLEKLHAALRGGYCIFQQESDDTVERLVKVLRGNISESKKVLDATLQEDLSRDADLRHSVTQTQIHNQVCLFSNECSDSSDDLLGVTALLLASPRDIFLQALPLKQQAALWWMRRADSTTLGTWLKKGTQHVWQTRPFITVTEG